MFLRASQTLLAPFSFRVAVFPPSPPFGLAFGIRGTLRTTKLFLDWQRRAKSYVRRGESLYPTPQSYSMYQGVPRRELSLGEYELARIMVVRRRGFGDPVPLSTLI